MSFGRRQQSPQPAPASSPGPAVVRATVPLPPPPARLEPPEASVPLAPLENLPHCANAAADIVALLMSTYSHLDHIDAECAIGAAAALTGEFALRSTGLPVPEKGMILGDATDDVLFHGAREGRSTAWMYIMHAAMEAGVAEYDLPKIEVINARTAQAMGGLSFPPLSVPEAHVPHERPANAGPRFRHRIIAIADAHDLSLREIVIALALATSQLITRTQEQLPPQIGVTLAAEIMFAAARMAPLAEAVEEEKRAPRRLAKPIV